MEWSQDLSTGIEKFDNQHKKLIQIIEELNTALKEKKYIKDHDIISNIIIELTEYAKFHFSSEEEFFKEINYPEKREHIEDHDEFVLKIIDFQLTLHNIVKTNKIDEIENLLKEIYNFVSEWIENHIKQIDKKYGEYYNNVYKKNSER